ncbi:MAG TPA: group I intron-associated PD-(D/E)XK endonuclease [Ktedonobacteraceae bacterium]|nr:group I intron-associated PD-(D/E)XK endonuclease [Ktedonobacteraceae bacterium]
MKDTSQQGLISKTAVMNRLIQLGYEVLLPWADHLGYDLAYYVETTERHFGFFVHRESQLVRVQVKTGRLEKDGTCIEFNTVSVTTNTKGSHHRKRGYVGKAEYFAVYLLDNGKVYMVSVDEAPKSGSMTLRFKKAGVIRSNGRQSWRVSYEEAVASGVKYNWAEDYEI